MGIRVLFRSSFSDRIVKWWRNGSIPELSHSQFHKRTVVCVLNSNFPDHWYPATAPWFNGPIAPNHRLQNTLVFFESDKAPTATCFPQMAHSIATQTTELNEAQQPPILFGWNAFDSPKCDLRIPTRLWLLENLCNSALYVLLRMQSINGPNQKYVWVMSMQPKQSVIQCDVDKDELSQRFGKPYHEELFSSLSLVALRLCDPEQIRPEIYGWMLFWQKFAVLLLATAFHNTIQYLY